MNYFLHHAINVKNVIDHMAKPITTEQYLDAVGGDNLIFEPVTLEEVEATYFYDLPAAPVEQSKFYDAIKTTKNRIDTTMGAFGKVLNSQLNGTGIEAAQAEIGSPRKAGQFAVMSAMFPLSDGQGITIVFHSPTNDPAKITEQDDLIAFRFLLNKRDVTHVVAPSGGQDISLKQTTLVLANLAERNSARFQAKQVENKQKQDELKTIQDATSQLQTEADTLTTQADDLTKQQQDAADAVARTKTLVDNQKARNAALQAQLDGLKTPAPVKPVPTITGSDDKTVVPDYSRRILVTRQNRLKEGDKLFSGLSVVVKASDRVIDIADADGKGIVRWTADGIGYKNKGYYLLTNGMKCTPSEIQNGEIEDDSTKPAPENGIREIKQGLNMDGEFKLDNGAVIKAYSQDIGNGLQGYVTITEDDGTAFRMESPSSQGGAMADTAAKLYKLYQAKKAGEYSVSGSALPVQNTKNNAADVGDVVTATDGGKYKVEGAGFGTATLKLEGDNSGQLFTINQLNSMGVLVLGVNDVDYVAIATQLLGEAEKTTNPDGTLDFATQDRLVDLVRAAGHSNGSGAVYGAQQAVLAYNAQIIAANKAKEAEPQPEPNPPEPTPTEQTLFWYGLRARPLGIGAQPAGQYTFIESDQVASDPRTAGLVADTDSTNYRWGAIGYPEKLADKLVKDFELVDLSVKQWNAATRAEKFTEFKDVFSRMIESDYSLTEVISSLIKPNGDLITNNPFYDDSEKVYHGNQLLTAMQEAGYTGSLASMVGTMYDELTQTEDDKKLKSDLSQDEAVKLLEAMQYGEKSLNDYVDIKAPITQLNQQLKAVYDLYAHMDSAIRDADFTFGKGDREALLGNYLDVDQMTARDISNTKTKGILPDGKTPVVTVPTGGSLFNVDKLIRNEYSKQEIMDVFSSLGGFTGNVKQPDPAPPAPAAETGNTAVTKALSDLQDLFDNETNIDAYLMKMEAAFNEIDAAGATTENEPFMQKVADKLTALMAAEGVA